MCSLWATGQLRGLSGVSSWLLQSIENAYGSSHLKLGGGLTPGCLSVLILTSGKFSFTSLKAGKHKAILMLKLNYIVRTYNVTEN